MHDFHLLEMGRLSLADYLLGLERRAPDVIGRPLDYVAYQRFMSASAIAVHWPVVHRIRRLRDDGVHLALLTNNVREFGGAWRATFPVEELFAIVVDSSEVGMRKPDPAIYEHTSALLAVEPDAAVFLDDNAENVARGGCGRPRDGALRCRPGGVARRARHHPRASGGQDPLTCISPISRVTPAADPGSHVRSAPTSTTSSSMRCNVDATVTSRTGSAKAPSRTMSPTAPTEKSPLTGLVPECRPLAVCT